MGRTKITCKKYEDEFAPHKHKISKLAAVGVSSGLGAMFGASRGIVWGPQTGTTGAGVGALLAGSATALGVKSVTKCPHCGKHQFF